MTDEKGKTPAKNRGRGHLISQRTAILTISILLGACAAGWLMTEFFPPDLPYRRAFFRQKWGDTALSWIEAFKLYDPFHSFWFSGVLALFFVVLLLCLATRWKGMITKSFRVTVPRQPSKRRDGAPGFTIPLGEAAGWKDEKDPVAHYGRKFGRAAPVSGDAVGRIIGITGRAFRSRGFRFASRSEDGSTVFAATRGHWRHLGNLIFHLGLLVITIGGVVGSRLGSSEILYGKRGDVLSISGDGTAVRIDEFRILMTGKMQVSDYITKVTVVDDSGAEVRVAEIEVNHPLRYRGTSIYQSSYYIAENEFEWATIMVSAPDSPEPAVLTLKQGSVEEIPGTELTVKAGRFLPDFRMMEGGPRSVSGAMNNPALEIILDGPGGRTSGWTFLMFPDFGTKFDRLDSVEFKDIEPVYYTGLELTRNPGASLFMLGMILGSAGLLLLYMFDYRVVHGSIDGTNIIVTGVTARWKVAFGEQLDRIGKKITSEIEKESTT
ncbi:MAG: cytochrome c biogenesis protein ResB [Candidatus Krumholzibacteria bacterium]|nr:cytochrome c biogenesis protein ResB [Candidatus Krumholzibacteria bacterium]